MSVKGDWGKLSAAIDEFDNVKRTVLRDATTVAKKAVFEEYQADFSKQRDPFGNTWEATKAGKSPVLVASGALANPQITSRTGEVKMRPEKHWVFHQIGANNMHKRVVLPFQVSQWDEPIQEKIEAEVLDHFKTDD